MSNKLKTALLFGSGMTVVFCVMSFASLQNGKEEIIRSFGAALAAGLVTGVLAYFFADRLNADKLFGKKDDRSKS